MAILAEAAFFGVSTSVLPCWSQCLFKRNTFHDRKLPTYTGYFGTIADDICPETIT